MNNNREALTLEKIGARIRIKRESLGMTQQELADMVNVTRNTISRYENGETEIGVIMLKNIADALSVTVLWLLFGFDYENCIRRIENRICTEK
ncbi:MAG: helix-turn-helix transcriptional regulator [Acutalibacteraceae bacterium]|nr:helix-turn-helix transcriptional regulator [Acutalibacteraceae bacterium]